MASRQVLIVSADERWLRVLEVTIRLGGAETISRRSVGDALRTPAHEGEHPTAIVVDLGAQTTPGELDDVRGLVENNAMPALVILPEGLETERERFVSVGATVLVRPYRPSELYAALWPADAVNVPAGAEAPLGVDEAPANHTPVADDPVATYEPVASDEPAGPVEGNGRPE